MDIVGSGDSIIHRRSIDGGPFDSQLLNSDSSDHDDKHILPNLNVVARSNVVDLLDPVDAISSNRDQSMVVAAGSRGVLKIFKVSDEGIWRVSDLRAMKSRRLTLMYSPSNVAWSKVKDELIATTSTNGAVVLWHAERGRMDMHYKSHTRSATCVHFHRSDEHLLISGSKDSTIMLYDTRTADPVRTFRSAKFDTVTVRDLSFCLHQSQHDSFISADEGGYVKVWDMRMDGPVSVFQPHQGYVSSIALSPSDPKLVASGGGRDKNIKVWNWCDHGHQEPFPLFQVETIAPVGRVYWRPDHPWQVASCAVVNDMSVLVWDIRRPYLPVISFYGHKDSVTDVWWSAAHPQRFVSSGKDGLLLMHKYGEGDPTLDHLCDTPIDLAPDGLLAVSVNAQIHLKNMDKWDINRSTLKLTAPERVHRSSAQRRAYATARRQQTYDAFRGPVQSRMACGLLDRARGSLQPTTFARLAQSYRMGGVSSIDDLCQMNARAAASLGKEGAERAETWRHLAVLLSQTDFQKQYDEEAIEFAAAEKKRWEVYVTEYENQGIWAPLRPRPQPETDVVLMQTRRHTTWRSAALARWRKVGGMDGGSKYAIRQEASALPCGDFYFGPGELRGAVSDSEDPECVEFTGLAREAFALKPHPLSTRYLALANMNGADKDWLPVADSQHWNPLNVLARTLSLVAEQGDVQLCAAAVLVCGHLISSVISDYRTEAWLHSYLGMLERLEMFHEAASILKWTWIRRLNQRTSESTYQKEELFHLRDLPYHSRKDIVPPGCISVGGYSYQSCTGNVKMGRCERCTDVVMPNCVLCDEVIYGQVWSCIKCNHTMHPEHSLTWFDEDPGSDVDCDLEEDWEVDHHSPARSCPLPWCECVCSIPFAEEDDVMLVESMESVTLRNRRESLFWSSAGRLFYNCDVAEPKEGELYEERMVRHPCGLTVEFTFEREKNVTPGSGEIFGLLPELAKEAVTNGKVANVYNLVLLIGCLGPTVFRQHLEIIRKEHERLQDCQLSADAMDMYRHLKAQEPPLDPWTALLELSTTGSIPMRSTTDVRSMLRMLSFARILRPLGSGVQGPLTARETHRHDVISSVFRATQPAETEQRNRKRFDRWQKKALDRRRKGARTSRKEKDSSRQRRETRESDDFVVLDPATGRPFPSAKAKKSSILERLTGTEREKRRRRREETRQCELDEEQREQTWWRWGGRCDARAQRRILNDELEDLFGTEEKEQVQPVTPSSPLLASGVSVSLQRHYHQLRETGDQCASRVASRRGLEARVESNRLAIALNGAYEERQIEYIGGEDWRTTLVRAESKPRPFVTTSDDVIPSGLRPTGTPMFHIGEEESNGASGENQQLTEAHEILTVIHSEASSNPVSASSLAEVAVAEPRGSVEDPPHLDARPESPPKTTTDPDERPVVYY